MISAIQYAKVQGLKVLAIDGGKEKAELCAKLGADASVDFMETADLTAEVLKITGGGSHGVLVTSSSVRAYEQALTYVRKRGVMICIGISKLTFSIDTRWASTRPNPV